MNGEISGEQVAKTKNTLANLINLTDQQRDEINELKTERDALDAEIRRLNALLAAQPQGTPYRKRPAVLSGRTVNQEVGCGPLYVTVNEDESGKPFEVFFKLGKSGSCQQSYLEALGVAMSVGLRYGADPQKYIEKFAGMRCPNPKLKDASGPGAHSCADAISQGLERALRLVLMHEPAASTATEAVPSDQPTLIDIVTEPLPPREIISQATMASGVGMCPKCSGRLVFQSGCTICVEQCGYVGKCG